MIRVSITAADIEQGVAGDCFRCAGALALARATGDDHAQIYECDWTMWIEVHCRHIAAPHQVAEFVMEFDDALADGVPPPEPLEFELPDQTDEAWQERCSYCGNLRAGSELDDGECSDCIAKAEGGAA